MAHTGSDHPDQHDDHADMAADFRNRFWISLVLTLPILILSPMFQTLVGLREAIRFPGDIYVLFGLSSAVFVYGGWPFLKGLLDELKARRSGMKTLISVAIATAYIYSSAVVFGLTGKMFFWELASHQVASGPFPSARARVPDRSGEFFGGLIGQPLLSRWLHLDRVRIPTVSIESGDPRFHRKSFICRRHCGGTKSVEPHE